MKCYRPSNSRQRMGLQGVVLQDTKEHPKMATCSKLPILWTNKTITRIARLQPNHIPKQRTKSKCRASHPPQAKLTQILPNASLVQKRSPLSTSSRQISSRIHPMSSKAKIIGRSRRKRQRGIGRRRSRASMSCKLRRFCRRGSIQSQT